MGQIKIVAIIPVFNEEDSIEDTIVTIKELGIIDDIIVIDDGSSDNTLNILLDLNIRVIQLANNRGKGYAIKKGINLTDFDFLVVLDGDIGKSSIEIQKLLIPVLNEETDISIAQFPSSIKKGGVGLVKNLARLGVFFYTGKKLNSTISGQRVYTKTSILAIDYIPDKFGVEIAMTIQALRKKFVIREVPVAMYHRESDRSLEGFIHRGKQFWDIFKTLIILLYRL